MKLTKHLLIAISILGLGASTAVYLYGWNPFSRSSWEDLGDKIKDTANKAGDAFKDAGNTIKDKAIDPAGNAFKDLGNKIKDKVIDPAGDAFKEAGNKIKEYSVTGWNETKKAAEKFGGYMVTAADETKEFGQMVYEKGLKPIGDNVQLYGSIAAKMVQNWTKGRPHHDYCDLSKAVLLDPPTTDTPEAKKADTEGLLPFVEKYAPVAWLEGNEDYYPIRFSEYMTAPGTSIISRKTGATIVPAGQVTMEKIYEMYKERDAKKYDDLDLAFSTADCTFFGSNPANFSDKDGNLTTPLYFITFEQNGKLYIQYLFFYGLNGPYDIGPFRGNVLDIQNFHESDLEHITVELDANTKEHLRTYYGSHGRTEGFWLDAKNKDLEYEGTHPVVYVAHYGHGLYPHAGTYVRIFGMANDVTGRGQKWTPKLIRLYTDNDSRFDPKTMGFMYFPGVYGKHGVGAMVGQSWFTNSVDTKDKDGKVTREGGDVGRPYTPSKWFCKNMPYRDISSSNPLTAIKETALTVGDGIEYAACIATKIPNATIPD